MNEEENRENLQNEELNNEVDTEKEKNEVPKKIEVVTGNGDLTISPVYEHLEVEKPKPKENKQIFIPEVKGTPAKRSEDDVEESKQENNEE